MSDRSFREMCDEHIGYFFPIFVDDDDVREIVLFCNGCDLFQRVPLAFDKHTVPENLRERLHETVHLFRRTHVCSDHDFWRFAIEVLCELIGGDVVERFLVVRTHFCDVVNTHRLDCPRSLFGFLCKAGVLREQR